MVIVVPRNSSDGVSVVVVWYGRGYGAHCRRDQTNRADVAVATAAVVAVPPKREARLVGARLRTERGAIRSVRRAHLRYCI